MKTRLFIFGTGAHARKVFHYAMALDHEVLGFVDENPGAVSPVCNVPLIAFSTLGAPADGTGIFVAIGRADVRRRLMDILGADGWSLPALVHPGAWRAPDAKLEAGVLVAAGAVVETGTVVGRGAIIDVGVVVDHDCRIGAFCHLKPGRVCLPGSIVVLDGNDAG